MAERAAINSRRAELPFIHELHALAPGATVSWDVPGQLVVAWPDVRVTLEQLPSHRLTSHLEEVLGFLREGCTLHDASLVRRLGKMSQCLSLTFEPGVDAAGRCAALVRGLAQVMHGVSFHASSVHAADGKLLASPRAGTPGVAFDEARRPPPVVALPPEVELGKPPSAWRVARRALVLAAVVRRAYLELEHWPDGPQTHHRLRHWLDTHELGLEAESEEALLLETPVGALDVYEDTGVGVWQTHGLGVLTWALGLGELPAYDEEPHPGDLTASVGLLADAPRALVAPRLRAPEELQRLRRQLVTVRWRLGRAQEQHRAMDLAAFVRGAPAGVFELEGLPLKEEDLALGGVPVARADPHAVRVCLGMNEERLRALLWVLGQRPLYSEVVLPA